MSTGALTFYMAHFETSLTPAKLISRVTTDVSEITSASGNVFDLTIPKSKMQLLFAFQNAGNVSITDTTSASDLLTNPLSKFKFAYDPLTFTGVDFSLAAINASESSSSYSVGDARPGLLYARYISLKLTGSAGNTAQFNNLSGARAAINTQINNGINTKFTALTAAGEKGIVTAEAPDTDLLNPTYRLITQIDNKGKMDARFTNTVLGDAVTEFKPVPLLVGDKFVFKISFTPAEGQKDVALSSTTAQPSTIDAIDGIISITLSDA